MQKNIHENKQVLQQIEWSTISHSITGHIHFQQNQYKIISFQQSPHKMQEILTKTRVFEELFYENEFKAFIEEIYLLDGDFNFLDKIQQINKHKALALTELNQLAILIECFFKHSKLIGRYFNISLLECEFIDFKRRVEKAFLTSFRKFVSADAEVDLEKHPLIRPLYHQQRELESKIRHILNASFNSQELKNKLQFNSIDIVNDRYVVPIKSDSYQSKLGQIIGRSESGNTLFIELHSVGQLNFKRIEILIKIQAILSKLELDLTKALCEFSLELSNISQFFLDCDEYIARVKFANEYNLSYPEIISTKEIKLTEAFHPLIKRPITNDIHLPSNKLGIIISGPNTGGKTATLKTLALTQIFLRYGLYIPAAHGEVFPYEKVFYFGNDQQNLNQGLSSFSAEVQNYSTLFDSFGETNLILIDEIFNSTSSEEASALAIAFFKQIQKHTNVHIVVSSHHQTLKTILHQEDDYLSAHMGFDIDSNTPTYKLHFGAPGSSHALKIFNALTHNKDNFRAIYENSLQFLDNKAIHYEKLLESLAEKENKLQKILVENQDLNKQLKNQKKSMEGIIKLKVQERVEKTENKLQKIQHQAEGLLQDIKKGHIQKSKNIQHKIAELKNETVAINPPAQEEESISYTNLSTPENYQIGKRYFCLALKKTVILKNITKNKKQGLVSAGSVSMRVELDTLRLANRPDLPKHKKQHIHSTFTTSRASQIEYDCRGMRLEEFQSLIEDVVSDLLLGELPYISIIHGHGTGVLKSWLRSFIKNHKDLTTIKDETGNDGETRITLI